MKVNEMQEGKTYTCVWCDCVYSGWSKVGIVQRHPWMVNLDIWEEEK